VCDYCGETVSDQSKWIIKSTPIGPGVNETERRFCCPDHANAWEAAGGKPR
jgi:hypothetical protein